MRPSTILLTTAAAAVSAQDLQDLASLSGALASLTTDPAYSSIVASIATADPNSLYSEVQSYAQSGLNELSEQAATATGSEGAALSSLYTSLQAGLSSANAAASSAFTLTGTNSGSGAQETGGSSSSNNNDDNDDSSSGAQTSESASGDVAEQSGNGAVATAVPIAMGAVGMAVLGML